MPPSRWDLAPAPGPAADIFARELRLTPLTAALLAQRMSDADAGAVERFLHPSLGDLHSPWDLPDMEKAADRLARAVREKERVVVHGDYDTDGVTATAVLIHTLRALGLDPAPHLPSRLEDGYGIADAFVEQAIRDKVDVAVTVDCGITEHDAVARLTDAGVDVIVTDHHEPVDDALPPALAVVDPKIPGSAYPFREITGVGVAFKLAWAVCERVAGSPKIGPTLRETLLKLLPVVATGTVADVAPLRDENRVFVAFGLKAFTRTLPGLHALLETSRGRPPVTAQTIAFALAPRLNAAGRLGDAGLALDLLLTDDPVEAQTLATELDRHNRDRQALCRTTVTEALAAMEQTHDPAGDAAFILARDGWHEGVIGIVAGKIAEERHRPTLVIAFPPGEDVGKGSARSVEGVNLFALLHACRDRFVRFGGHEMAAGFSIRRDQVDPLRQDLLARCRAVFDANDLGPTLTLDAEVRLDDLTDYQARELDLLAPFGDANPPPLFLLRGIRVAGSPQLMGRDQQHFSFEASQNGTALRAVVFNNTDWCRAIDRSCRTWDLAARLALNTWRGLDRPELHVVDMRPAS